MFPFLAAEKEVDRPIAPDQAVFASLAEGSVEVALRDRGRSGRPTFGGCAEGR
jgi:hypothetical protein